MKYGRILVLLLSMLTLTGCARIRPPRRTQPVERVLLTTGYCKCGKCCSWKRTWYGRPVYSSGSLRGKPKKVGITATGMRAGHGTIAADTSRFPFGTIMYIEGYGYGRVEDLGSAIKGDHIDLYFRSHRQAQEWGRQSKRIKVWLKP